MSYRLEDIVANLNNIWATMAGITATLAYEPRAVQAPPMLYTLLDSVERTDATTSAGSNSRLVAVRYRLISRIMLSWRDTEQAERDVRYYVSAALDLMDVDTNRTLSGLITAGSGATIDTITTGWIVADGSEYRTVDIATNVHDKRLRG